MWVKAIKWPSGCTDFRAMEAAPPTTEDELKLLEIDEESEAFTAILERWKVAGRKSGALEAEDDAGDESDEG